MTPTEQEIEFFIDHQDFFEGLWKPVFGDLVLLWNGDKGEWGKDVWCVIGRFSEDAVDVIRESDGAIGAALIVDCVPLLRQGQLQAMLEERGYTVCLTGPYMLPKNYQVILAREDDETEVQYGPTPSIALGRALTEVLKEEPNDQEEA